MLNAVLAFLAMLLWFSSYVLFFLPDVLRWWHDRPYRNAMSEIERLQAVREYAAWVRDMPPPPPRRRAGPVMVPVPVKPPIGGSPVPFPGRRMIGN